MNLPIALRHQCRICGSRAPHCFLTLPDYPLADNHVRDTGGEDEFRAELRIYRCPDCGTVQTQHDVDLSRYYRDYAYTVSQSGFARRFMERLAEVVCRRYELPAGSGVIEIGSSDGYQLRCFAERGMRVLGYEPGADLAAQAESQGVATVCGLFDEAALGAIPAEMLPARAVLSFNTFDHIPDPLPVLRAVRSVLDPVDGVVIIEVHDLEKIAERAEACLFAHEHSIYLSARTMAGLLGRADLKLLSIDLLPESERRGNSLLIAAGATGSRWKEAEPPAGAWLDQLEHAAAYEDLSRRILIGHRGLADHVRAQRRAGRRVAGYGGSGRGIATLAIAGLGPEDIAYVCDQNSSFEGMLMPSSHVPVALPSRLGDDPVDEVIVFSYGYLDEIREGIAPYLRPGTPVRSVLELISG